MLQDLHSLPINSIMHRLDHILISRELVVHTTVRMTVKSNEIMLPIELT